MPPKQPRHQLKVEQKSSLAAMQQLEGRSDDELEAETKFRAAAQALLGARAAERYDAKTARMHFQKALAAARPQERMQLRRMAEASLALAERRAGDLKTAAEKLGQTPPTGRQLLALRAMGLIVPPPGSSPWLRVRGILLLVGIVVLLMAIGFGLAMLISLPFGGLSWQLGLFWGFMIVVVAIVVLIVLGRRRQKRAKAEAAAKRAGG